MKQQEKNRRVYVNVLVEFGTDGQMLPRAIHWEDGRTYGIDRVLDVRAAHAMRSGGQGDRYTVRIGGRETYLFFEHSGEYGDQNPGKWFVERKG